MPDIEIYYFTGTGNSLAIARRLAAGTGAKLTAVPTVMERERVETEAGAIGLVFPIYFGENDLGVPLIVGRFLEKLTDLGGKYVFAVCTCGYMPGATVGNLAALIAARGGKLSAGYALNMSDKAFAKEILKKLCQVCGMRRLGERVAAGGARKKAAARERRLAAVIATAKARGRCRLETPGLLGRLLYAPMLHLLIKPVFRSRYEKLAEVKERLPFAQLVPLADRSFRTSDKCIGCGTCARVCPVGNIRLEDKRPVWQHRCENCYACYTWCPQQAIGGEIVKYNEWYHHPEVTLADMLNK